MKKSLLIAGMLLLFLSCNTASESKKNIQNKTYSYLALGDSYTIGESVPADQRWPVQLTKELKEKGYSIDDLKIIATTGWRTDELLKAMEMELGEKQYDLVSVLIGVNNQYQSKPILVYKAELETILQEAIGVSAKGKEGVFMMSIPDYGVTSFGINSGRKNIGNEIDAYNEVAKNLSKTYGIPFYDITEISRKAKNNEDLIAADGLHPSGKMYGLWVKKITPEVKNLMEN